jgi:pyruvate-ferredoxin/flavodoxin oxidoreductase
MELKEIIDTAWAPQAEKLTYKIKTALQDVQGMLELEAQKGLGQNPDYLHKSMGDFASNALDLSSISGVLSKSGNQRRLEPDQSLRLNCLVKEFESLLINLDVNLAKPQISKSTDPKTTEVAVIKHLNSMARVFSLLRQAWLEKNSKFNPEFHDNFFKTFSWESLNSDEVSLCPPFVVALYENPSRDFWYSNLLPLLTSGLPVKVLLERTGFRNDYQGYGRSAALRCSLETEMLPVALKSVYVMQDTVLRPEATQCLLKGLCSPRPGLFSILSEPDEFRNNLAVQTRAFPIFSYDPDRSPIFVKRFDLSGNLNLKGDWVESVLDFINGTGKKDRIDRKLNFAHFAIGADGFENEFSPLPANRSEDGLPLSDWLELSAGARSNKVPYIAGTDVRGNLTKMVPSMKVVAQSDDRLHIWRSLCEVSGVSNPWITDLETKIRNEISQQKQSEIQELKTKIADEIKEARRSAVAEAMVNLASRLTGRETDLSVPQNKPEQKSTLKEGSEPSSKNIKPMVTLSDEPWIDSKQCTSCDDCITINNKIFAYNENKQAYIKDPKAGPYKDLLRAAKKCSAKIIFPGKDPG